MAALDKLFTDDVVWHTPGTNQLAGDHKGKEETFNARRDRASSARPNVRRNT